jgi:glycosyltransferase involved in cell wall biosynthesis
VLLAAGEQYRPVTDPEELQRVREKYDLPSRFILYLGGFDVRKNVPQLVRAYAGLVDETDAGSLGKPPASPDALLLVIAGGLPALDTAFTPDPRRAAAEAGVLDRVRFAGWVDEADKPTVYSLADLFVFPSVYEGFGLPVAEAAACGAPVLTSNRSSLPEVDPAAVLVDPEDEAALARGLTQAIARLRMPTDSVRRTWQDVAQETRHTWSIHQ